MPADQPVGGGGRLWAGGGGRAGGVCADLRGGCAGELPGDGGDWEGGFRPQDEALLQPDQRVHGEPERRGPALPAHLRPAARHHLLPAPVGVRGLPLQLRTLLLHRQHAGQHLHACRDVRGPLRGRGSVQEIPVRTEPPQRAGRGVRDLDAVPGLLGAGGPTPGARGPPPGPQQHLLLGAVVRGVQALLQGGGAAAGLPAAAAAHQLLLHSGARDHTHTHDVNSNHHRHKFPKKLESIATFWCRSDVPDVIATNGLVSKEMHGGEDSQAEWTLTNYS